MIGPEGAASILERDAARAPDVAPHLKLTSADLLGLGIVDEVVPDGVDDTVAAVVRAVDDAADGRAEGGRRRRFDEATERWLVTGTGDS